MKLWAYFTLEVKDNNGRILRRIRRRSRSYVIAFLDILSGDWANANRTVTDTGGTARTLTPGVDIDIYGLAAVTTHGLVVGTGTTTVAISDTKLVTQIAEGSGAGKLNHQVTTINAPSTSGSTRSFTAQRVFVNNSGAAITINECGAYGRDPVNSWYFCLIRDIVSGGLAVPDGGSATLTYTIGVTA